MKFKTTIAVALSLHLANVCWAADPKPEDPLKEPTTADVAKQNCLRAAGHCRAGCPQITAPYARSSDDGHSLGYRVGGGAAVGGDAPCRAEGTWGWDYGGLLLPKRVALNWWHGAHEQGAAGSYRTK